MFCWDSFFYITTILKTTKPSLHCQRTAQPCWDSAFLTNWSGPFWSYTGVSCGPPLYVANGVVRGAVFQFGDVVVYSCYPGYTMEGSSRSVCLENGTWIPPPTCKGSASNWPVVSGTWSSWRSFLHLWILIFLTGLANVHMQTLAMVIWALSNDIFIANDYKATLLVNGLRFRCTFWAYKDSIFFLLFVFL